jgi:protein-disulfide isomerase
VAEPKKRKTTETAAASGSEVHGGRSRTLERRRERQQQEKREQQKTVLIIGGVIAALIVVLIVAANWPATGEIADGVRYEGLPAGASVEGFPQIGSPSALVEVREYSSFACPACRQFHDLAIEGIMQRVRAGDIRFVYVPMYSTGGVSDGRLASRAGVCIAQQNPLTFWRFHDTLFKWQGLYGNTAYTRPRIGSAVAPLGLDGGALNSCIDGAASGAIVDAAELAARNLPGFTGTPTITVNGVIVPDSLSEINAAIDSTLRAAGSAPGATPLDATPVQAAAEVSEAAATAEATQAP